LPHQGTFDEFDQQQVGNRHRNQEQEVQTW
jgi:hypothetical protein